MSKISLSPNASGTGTFTIQSPAGDTNRTFTLPDEDGELSVGGGGGFSYDAVSGATQDLDMDNGNFFDGGVHAADTTLTFSNLEAQANWRYKFTPEIVSGQWSIDKLIYISQSRNLNLAVTGLLASISSPSGFFFKPDGTKVFIVGYATDEVHEFNLGIAWDITTMSYVDGFDVAAQAGYPHSLFFKTDGTKMYVLGSTLQTVFEYNLSTAWDVSTASYSNNNYSVAGKESSPEGMFFKGDGTKMYITGLTGDDVNEYTLSTPWAVTSATYATVFSVSTETINPSAITFKPDGTKMYLGDSSNDEIFEYDLSTPWSVSTASYNDKFGDVTNEESSLEAIIFHPDGNRFYVLGRGGDDITEYSVGEVSTLTLPSSVTNTTYLKDVQAGKSHLYEFLTVDSGTTVEIIGEETV